MSHVGDAVIALLSGQLREPVALDKWAGWYRRHVAAMTAPVDFERPILRLAEQLAVYADLHHARYESPIGDDGVLGQEWETMARALLGLLNGETGRLDCGTVDKAIRGMGMAAGVNLDD